MKSRYTIYLVLFLFVVTNCSVGETSHNLEQAEGKLLNQTTPSGIPYYFSDDIHQVLSGDSNHSLEGSSSSETNEQRYDPQQYLLGVVLAAELNTSYIKGNLEATFNHLAEIQERFAKHADRPELFVAEQLTAYTLTELVFPALTNYEALEEYEQVDLGFKEIELLKYAAELLTKYGNPNAELMSLLLHHLADELPSNQLKAYAETSIESATKKFPSIQGCTDCTKKEFLVSGGKVNWVAAGVEKLSTY